MNIIDKRTPDIVPFKEILIGECFLDHDDELNIKLNVSSYDNRGNAVVLNDGQIWRCEENTEVRRVKTSVIITD